MRGSPCKNLNHITLIIYCLYDPTKRPDCPLVLKIHLENQDWIREFNISGCPRDAMVKAMDYEIVVSDFEFHFLYWVHFRIYTLGKGMNPRLILQAMG